MYGVSEAVMTRAKLARFSSYSPKYRLIAIKSMKSVFSACQLQCVCHAEHAMLSICHVERPPASANWTNRGEDCGVLHGGGTREQYVYGHMLTHTGPKQKKREKRIRIEMTAVSPELPKLPHKHTLTLNTRTK